MKNIISILVIAFMATSIQAQDNAAATAKGKDKQLTTEQAAQKIVDKFNGIVGGLSAEQQSQLRVAATEFVSKRKEIKGKTKSADMGGKDNEALKANRAAFKDKLKNILTTQQLLKLRQYKKANKGKAKDPAKANDADELIPND